MTADDGRLLRLGRQTLVARDVLFDSLANNSGAASRCAASRSSAQLVEAIEHIFINSNCNSFHIRKYIKTVAVGFTREVARLPRRTPTGWKSKSPERMWRSDTRLARGGVCSRRRFRNRSRDASHSTKFRENCEPFSPELLVGSRSQGGAVARQPANQTRAPRHTAAAPASCPVLCR